MAVVKINIEVEKVNRITKDSSEYTYYEFVSGCMTIAQIKETEGKIDIYLDLTKYHCIKDVDMTLSDAIEYVKEEITYFFDHVGLDTVFDNKELMLHEFDF